MRRILLTVLSLSFAALALGAAPTAPAMPEPPTFSGDPLADLPGTALVADEAASIVGGEVIMTLDAARSKLTVKVFSGDYDSDQKRHAPKPTQVFEIDVHNRIVDTTKAPLMAAPGQKLPAGAALTTKPGQFPEGFWKIGEIVECGGKYSPYMIKTDAVGEVDIYADGTRVGTVRDIGYALHANTNDFSVSKSYGCVILQKSDDLRLAKLLKADRAELEARRPGIPHGVSQTITIRGRCND